MAEALLGRSWALRTVCTVWPGLLCCGYHTRGQVRTPVLLSFQTQLPHLSKEDVFRRTLWVPRDWPGCFWVLGVGVGRPPLSARTSLPVSVFSMGLPLKTSYEEKFLS